MCEPHIKINDCLNIKNRIIFVENKRKQSITQIDKQRVGNDNETPIG